MAWIEPKTNWADSDRMTAAEFSRICQNLQYLNPAYEEKTEWTQDDIIGVYDIERVRYYLAQIDTASGTLEGVPEASANADFFNHIESLMQDIKNRLDLLAVNVAAAIYPMESGYYAAETAEAYV